MVNFGYTEQKFLKIGNNFLYPPVFKTGLENLDVLKSTAKFNSLHAIFVIRVHFLRHRNLKSLIHKFTYCDM